MKPISCHIIYFFPHERSLHHMLVTISSTQVPPSPSVSTFAPRGLGGAHMTRPYALACTRTSCHWTTSQATRSRWPRSWGRGGCLSSLPALRPLVRNRWHPTAPGACCVDGRALGGTVAPCYEYKYVLVFFAPPRESNNGNKDRNKDGAARQLFCRSTGCHGMSRRRRRVDALVHRCLHDLELPDRTDMSVGRRHSQP